MCKLISFPGTICCMYGCCPSGTVCNAEGGCDSLETSPQSQTSESASEPRPSPSTCGAASIITSQTTVTNNQVNTLFVTVTFVETCTLMTTSPGTSSSSLSPPGFNSSSTGASFPATTWTEPDGATVVSS